MTPVATEISGIKGDRICFVQTAREKEHSNFLFLKEFLAKKSIYPYIPSLIRILSLARKLGFQGMLIDRIPCEKSPLLTEENEVLAQRNIGYNNSDVYKFSFFSEEDESKIAKEHFLGYAVLKVDRDSQGAPLCAHVYEAVLPPPRLSEENNFLHCRRQYQVANTLGDGFEVEGALYAQQNSKTFVCAHVALRSALSCILPQGDISYSALFRLSGKREGLDPDDMDNVFNGLGLHYRKITYPPDPCPEYMRELYGFTESCCAALLGFELPNDRFHIVPIFGHTFNEDSWVPPSNWGYFKSQTFRFFSSEQWLSSHLMHDDNFGPYYCMPRQFLTKENFRLLYGISTRKPALYSINAELMAIDFFHQSVRLLQSIPATDPWSDLFAVFASQKRLVLRSIYLAKAKYLEHLQKIAIGGSADTVGTIRDVLPDHFWMVEASMPELFSASREKFGEVIIFPTGDNLSFGPCSLVCMRLPSGVIIRDATDCGKWLFHQSSIQGHTAIYSSAPCRL